MSVFGEYFSLTPGPTGCPGSGPGSGRGTPPWPSCCRTARKKKEKKRTQQTNKNKKTKTHRWHNSRRLRGVQTKWQWTTSDLIHPYAPAHRTHASEVRSAASTVVEGHISWRWMEDRSGRDRPEGMMETPQRIRQVKTRTRPNATLLVLQEPSICRVAPAARLTQGKLHICSTHRDMKGKAKVPGRNWGMLQRDREKQPKWKILPGKNLRDEVHGVGVALDALLPVLWEVSQHFQRHDADGDVIHVRPDLQGNQDHAGV